MNLKVEVAFSLLLGDYFFLFFVAVYGNGTLDTVKKVFEEMTRDKTVVTATFGLAPGRHGHNEDFEEECVRIIDEYFDQPPETRNDMASVQSVELLVLSMDEDGRENVRKAWARGVRKW